MRNSLLLVLAPAALIAGATSGPAAAQTTPVTPSMMTVTLDHPSTGGPPTGAPGKAVVLGQLTEDAIPDAAVLHGPGAGGNHYLYLLYSADRRNAWISVPGNHSSIALLPKAYANKSRDGLVSIGPNGLQRLLWDSSDTVRNLVPTLVSGTAAWVGASELQVVQQTDTGFMIAAIGQGNRTILRASWNPSTDAISVLPILLTDEVMVTMRVLNWSDDGELEYACASAAGVTVLDASGAVLDATFAEQNSGSQLQVLSTSATGHTQDLLAWVRSAHGFTDFVTVIGDNFDTANNPIWFGGLNVQQLAVANVGDDSRKELVVLCEGFSFAFGLRYAGPAPSGFTQSTTFLIDLEKGRTAVDDYNKLWSPTGSTLYASGTGPYGPPVNPGPAPAIATMDLDGDSDDDLLLAGHPGSSNRAMVYFGAVFNEENQRGSEDRVRAWLPSYDYYHDAVAQEVTLKFNQAPELPEEGPAAEATHARIVVWKGNPTNPAAGATMVTALTNDLATWGGPYEVSIEQVGTNPSNFAKIHVEISYLKLHPSTNAMAAAYPAYHEKIDVADPRANGQGPCFNEWITFQDRGTVPGSPGSGSAVGTSVGGTANRPPISPPSSTSPPASP
jgi:hypothetical protein